MPVLAVQRLTADGHCELRLQVARQLPVPVSHMLEATHRALAAAPAVEPQLEE